MIPTFLEWISRIEEGFLTPDQQEGDNVFFGIHDLNGPIDVTKMGHCITPIRSVEKGHVLVEKPIKTRHRGLRKMMSKDGGLLKIASGSLRRVPDELVIGGDKGHKLFMYMPGKYHKNIASKLDRKMMSADSPNTNPMMPNMPFDKQLPPPPPPTHTSPLQRRPMW